MKTVAVERVFDYVPPSDRRIAVRFLPGTYRGVIDAAASAIERAGAGRVVAHDEVAVTVDASHAFKARQRA